MLKRQEYVGHQKKNTSPTSFIPRWCRHPAHHRLFGVHPDPSGQHAHRPCLRVVHGFGPCGAEYWRANWRPVALVVTVFCQPWLCLSLFRSCACFYRVFFAEKSLFFWKMRGGDHPFGQDINPTCPGRCRQGSQWADKQTPYSHEWHFFCSCRLPLFRACGTSPPPGDIALMYKPSVDDISLAK